jgi:ADP-ribose pyrophosphatase YjhB (NUDIX family)
MENGVTMVGAALIFRNSKLLLLDNLNYRKRGEPYMGPPGGKVASGEDILRCIKREAKEETNLDVIVEELVGVSRFGLIDGAHEVHSYVSNIIGGEIKIMEPEKTGSIIFCDIHDIRTMYNDKILVNSLRDLYEKELLQRRMGY